eukprot:213527_1
MGYTQLLVLPPSSSPSQLPTISPSISPSQPPTISPSSTPSNAPSLAPTSSPTNYPSTSPSFAPSVHPPTRPTYYPYIQLDRFDTISDWNTKGNVSIIASPNCPPNSAISPKTNMICISNMSIWDGQYYWKHFDSDVNASLYFNKDRNTYMYEYYLRTDGNSSYYEYYINHYEENQIAMTKCNEGVSNIRDCIGKWKHFDNTTWILDEYMISTTCNDICVYDSVFSNSYVPNGAKFKWSSYDFVRQTNVYVCDECYSLYDNAVSLSGFPNFDIKVQNVDLENVFIWAITSGDWTEAHSICFVGSNLGDEYIFDIDSCSSAGKWQSYNYQQGEIVDDPTMMFSECPSTTELAKVTANAKICVNESSEISLNGVYKWQDYNERLEASIYYNIQTHMYIYSYMDESGQYQYHIHGNPDNKTAYAKCYVTNRILGIEYCIGGWEIYYNNTFTIDTDMIATPCDDICVINGGDAWIANQSTFVFSYFNKTLSTNVYHCKECTDEYNYQDGAYLFGYTDALSNYYWSIGSSAYNIPDYVCFLGNDFDFDYIFDINNCLNQLNDVGFFTGTNLTLTAIKCSDDKLESIETCIKLNGNSEFEKTYLIESYYQDIAIGFDLNFVGASTETFGIQYSCSEEPNSQYNNLTYFDTEIISVTTFIDNIVYSLPKSCNYMRYISIKFESMIEDKSFIYIDNIYLYYNVDSMILFDPMDGNITWLTTPEIVIQDYVINEYCSLNSKCYEMNVLSPTYDFVHITKTIDIGYNYYNFKDFNLRWQIITTGLSEYSLLNVEIQCD